MNAQPLTRPRQIVIFVVVLVLAVTLKLVIADIAMRLAHGKFWLAAVLYTAAHVVVVLVIQYIRQFLALVLALSIKLLIANVAMRMAHGRFWIAGLLYAAAHLVLVLLINAVSQVTTEMRRVASTDVLEERIGDLNELYPRKVQRDGIFRAHIWLVKARIWYWMHLISLSLTHAFAHYIQGFGRPPRRDK